MLKIKEFDENKLNIDDNENNVETTNLNIIDEETTNDLNENQQFDPDNGEQFDNKSPTDNNSCKNDEGILY